MNRNYNYIFVLIFCLLLSQNLTAQNHTGFRDIRDKFHVFDNGERHQLEHLNVQSYKVGYKYIAYIDNSSQLKVYSKGETVVLSDNAPQLYYATEHQVVYYIFGFLKVYADGKDQAIAAYIQTPFKASDSLVVFVDQYDYLKVFNGHKMYELDTWPPKGFMRGSSLGVQVGENILAYVNSNDQFMAYYQGEQFELEPYAPKKYKVGRNTVAFINEFDQFNIYQDGEIYEVETFRPASFKVGDDIVAYVDQNGYFKVFKDGMMQEIDDAQPQSYSVKDGMIVFVDFQGYFKVFHKNVLTTLETYKPDIHKYDEDLLAYLDISGNLKAYYNGEVTKVSSERIKSFNVMGNVLMFTFGNKIHKFFYKNKVY